MSSMLSKINAFIQALFSLFMPKSFKRLILMSTLYSVGTEAKTFPQWSLAELNSNFHLARSTAAIESAISLKDQVWEGVDLKTLLENDLDVYDNLGNDFIPDSMLKSTSESLADELPAWIRYNRADMIKDLTVVLSCSSVNKMGLA